MKIELIKQIVELAKGFHLRQLNIVMAPGSNVGIFYGYDGFCNYNRIEVWEHFPLLITRAVQGWNRIYTNRGKGLIRFALNGNSNLILTWKTKSIIVTDYNSTDTLTVEEVCMLEALTEVLK